jgi:putative DNA primase/helicase
MSYSASARQQPHNPKTPESATANVRTSIRRGTGDPQRDVLARLTGVKPQPGGGWTAICPAHEDRRASLSVNVGDGGKVLLHCHAGCKTEAVVAALDLGMADLFPDDRPAPVKRCIVATYDYTDEADTVLFQAVRYFPKGFSQRRPDGKGGWIWKLGDVRRVLYRLPEIVAAPLDQTVFVVEGEKDVDRLAEENILATTCAMGAGKWQPEYNEALTGRQIVILPDNDEPGRAHARQVAQALCGVAASVKVVELPGLPPKGDVSDFLDNDGTASQLWKIVEGTSVYAPPPVDRPSVGDERAQAPPADDGDTAADPEHLTDLGNARRVVRQHGADLRYCHPARRWLVWDGARWAEDTTAEAVRRVKQTQADLYRRTAEAIRQLGDVGDDEERKRRLATLTATLKHALRWEEAKRIVSCLELAQSEPGIPVRPGDLDADAWLLNVLNGTIDLRTGRLRPHRRDDLITKLAPVIYDPDARCPLWERSLHRWMGGSEGLKTYLQRVVGYGLTGDVSEQLLWLFYGLGANGKSTFLLILLAMLGDYGMQAVADLLMTKKHEAHPTERADLFGRRLVATIETEEGKRLAEALMKQLTGGDKVRARKMRQDFFEFAPTHKIVLCANHKPVVRGTDLAVWRRIKLVPFGVTIPEHEKDRALPGKLKAELPGILAWAVRGCLDWQREGLAEPDEVRQATEEYQREQDTVEKFLAECCLRVPEAKVKVSALHEAYGRWSGDKFTTQPEFGDRLRAKGFDSKRSKNGYFWHGLALAGVGDADVEGEPG